MKNTDKLPFNTQYKSEISHICWPNEDGALVPYEVTGWIIFHINSPTHTHEWPEKKVGGSTCNSKIKLSTTFSWQWSPSKKLWQKI